MAEKKSSKKAQRKIMIRSMTGFGKSIAECPYGKIVVEIKSLNHKNLSITCNSFNGLFLLEEKIQKSCEGKVFRGKVFLKITMEDTAKHKSLQKIQINEMVAREYLRKIKKLQKKLGVKGEIGIHDLLKYPGIMTTGGEKADKRPWPYVKKAVENAIDKLVEYRKKEGLRLAKDFNIRLRRIETNIRLIREYEKQSVAEYRGKLIASIRDIAKKAEPDKGRVEIEVAAFAKNCDIAEERTRLKGHIIAYKDAMKEIKTDAGKKMDFITQEMQREINTIGAKSGDLRISGAVIEIKSEIEKMREQIKNIE